MEAGSGVIVAQEVTPQSADSPRLGPMLELLDQNLAGIGVPATERCPLLFTADAGYCSERNLGMLAERQFAYVATGRERHHQAGIGQHSMRSKLQTPEGREVYAVARSSLRSTGLPNTFGASGNSCSVASTKWQLDPQPAEAVEGKPGGRGFVKPGLKRQILSTGPFRGATARVRSNWTPQTNHLHISPLVSANRFHTPLDADYSDSAQGGIHLNGRTLPRVVIHDRQSSEAPPRNGAVTNEVHGPLLVRPFGSRNDHPGSCCALTTPLSS